MGINCPNYLTSDLVFEERKIGISRRNKYWIMKENGF
jgi:hypothetical protein